MWYWSCREAPRSVGQARKGGAPRLPRDPVLHQSPHVWLSDLLVTGPGGCLPQGQLQDSPWRVSRTASATSCFLMRCGVMGRWLGVQASPRWPQLLTTGPGTGRKLGCRELPLTGDPRQCEEGPGGGSISAGLARAHPPENACRQPGRRDRPHPVSLPAAQDQLPSNPRVQSAPGSPETWYFTSQRSRLLRDCKGPSK